ncbi:MAG: prepilin-type N-terminal cleavage/methylation domain-containing protein [Candidatus Omnitrophota bacterium]
MMILETGRNKPADYRLACKARTYFKQGFTLLELLCVITIISLLFAISVPTLSKTARNFYFTNKAKQIEALLVFIKKTSALEKRKYKLSIDLNENSYSVAAETAASDSNYQEFAQFQDSLLGKKTLPPGLGFKTQSDYQQVLEIIFEPLGNISAQEFLVYDQNQHSAKFQTTLSGQIILEFI